MLIEHLIPPWSEKLDLLTLLHILITHFATYPLAMHHPTARAIFEKMMAEDHCSQWMGIEPLLLEEGHCRLRMTVKRQMLNGFGLLHGGIAYAFADSAFAFASNALGRMAVSIQGSMNFASSAQEGEVLIAEAKALRVSHKTADFDVNVWAEGTPEQVRYYFRGTVYRSSRNLLTGG